jgi:hypothetical protein
MSDETINILFLGDIVGRPGREAVRVRLPELVREHAADLVIANGENLAGGLGVTPETAQEMLALGVDVLTMGNHVWKHREFMEYAKSEARILRPVNYPPGAPGYGAGVFQSHSGVTVGVLNLIGRIFMEPLDCPFRAADAEIEALRGKTRVIVVDFHAEATSEKVALGWHLSGRVSALIGSHTHVQTADERILPPGTAYITDVGMVGPRDSVIGVKRELIISRFRTGLPTKFEVATGPAVLCAVVVAVDTETGLARSITRVLELVALDE